MAIKNSLDDIVSMDIEISTPASSDESFSNMLFVVEAPDETADTDIGSSMISISKASDLTEYGYSEDSQAYIMATVAFSQSPSPDVIYVVQKTDDDDMETVLDNALEAGGWYGIALSSTFYDSDILSSVITWTETNEKLFGYTFVDSTNSVTLTNYYRTFAVYGGGVPDTEETPEANYYINVAMMAKCFGYDPGSETWALKVLAGVEPCQLSTSMKSYCDDNNYTYFTTYASKNITSNMGGKVLAGEWIDVIRFRDWLKNDIQERVFNLFVLNTKIAFTDDGITAIGNKVEESLKQGQIVGGIAPTQYDSDGVETAGYTLTVPLAADLTDTERASRQLTGVKFTARLAGAIQAADISGNLVA